MKYPQTLPAFSIHEAKAAHALLASRVATMMGRKLEEGDWSYVYCAAKGIPEQGWSNLNIDVTYGSLGIEHKMLCVQSKKTIKEFCGTSLMHPAATRSIRIPADEPDPTAAARDVLAQYSDLIQQRRQKVAESAPGKEPDMRTGWLLWQESLREFLYFEHEMLAPKPDDYWAEWKESGGGTRKTSLNLWVYEKESGRKRYSITTSAGAKIQPYFDVPPPNDPNLYYFWVQGEKLESGMVRVWITSTTALLLESLLGDIETTTLNAAILSAAERLAEAPEKYLTSPGPKATEARPLLISSVAYDVLSYAFAGVSDEHMIQLFARYLAG